MLEKKIDIRNFTIKDVLPLYLKLLKNHTYFKTKTLAKLILRQLHFKKDYQYPQLQNRMSCMIAKLNFKLKNKDLIEKFNSRTYIVFNELKDAKIELLNNKIVISNTPNNIQHKIIKKENKVIFYS